MNNIVSYGRQLYKKVYNKIDRRGALLLQACEGNEEEDVVALLKSGVDVNVQDKYGNTPLHLACKTEVGLMGYAAGNYDIVKLLLEHGASIEAKNNKGNTPMAIAIGNRNMNISKLLLEYGADVNTKKYGNTLLHIILSPCDAWRKCFPEMFELILTNERVDLSIKNNEEKTPLHCACSQGLIDMAKRLVEAGANLNAKDALDKKPLDLLKEWCEKNSNTSLYSSYEQKLNESYNKSKPMYKDIEALWGN